MILDHIFMEEINLKLGDFEITKYGSDEEFYGGCPTCEYGSEYINHVCLEILLNNSIKRIVHIETNRKYEHSTILSVGNMIKFLCNLEKTINYNDFLIKLYETFNNEKDESCRYVKIEENDA